MYPLCSTELPSQTDKHPYKKNYPLKSQCMVFM